ncbi:MAG: pseudouridine-5'-phosphate glycosidase [Mogibacterium sp.]|nr:pseudouridine-5'-phosphate glycosidase [Mogibacterium sp.]
MSGLIVESALLTHGLVSTDNGRILNVWDPDWLIGWMDRGRPVAADVEEFLFFRGRADEAVRIGYSAYDKAKSGGATGALTASGTIRLCEERGAEIAVSCGIGGLTAGQGIEKSNDLAALAHTDISLAATAFKDMFDQYYTVQAALTAGISVYSMNATWHPGYMFSGPAGKGGAPEIPFSDEMHKGALYLNPISSDEMLSDMSIIETAVEYGKEEALQGRAFHPAVNAKIDELTGGRSSELQLLALADNVRKVKRMLETRK